MPGTEVPRILDDELLLEISLTHTAHIVVEGPSDAGFFQAWLEEVANKRKVVVTSVDRIQVDSAHVELLGLPDGNRGRVVAIAKKAEAASAPLVGIADRDCGHHVAKHQYNTLYWTDYPALESYALDEATLDRANLLVFGGRLPDGSELIRQLMPALQTLYSVRAMHEHLATPNFRSGFRSGGSLELFDVAAALPAALRPLLPTYAMPKFSDPREIAYGHDIAELLMVSFANTFKNQIGLISVEAIEGVLLTCLHALGRYKSEALFVRLRAWVSSP